MRPPSKRIVIFNHKGGVGKTTLTVNVAFEMAALGKKVLLVDSDPQCNITSYLVSDDVVDDLLDKSDGSDGRTIWSALKAIVDGEGAIKIIEPYEVHENLFLVPGDIQLSEFETELGQLWGECFQRKNRGYRGTYALSNIVDELCKKYKIDYVFYDAGPNIGPLNRAIILDCDYFIIAAACDLFSIRALKTLGRSIASWVKDWQTISALAPSETCLLPGRPMVLGFIPQNFRIYKQRPASYHFQFLGRLERGVKEQIIAVMKRVDPSFVTPRHGLKIGAVKDFGQLVSASQEEGVPLSEVSIGNQEQKKEAKMVFGKIASKIIELTS